jgi:hypothetical protein
MDVNEHEKLSIRHCPIFHSHSRIFNNGHNLYPKLSVKPAFEQHSLLLSSLHSHCQRFHVGALLYIGGFEKNLLHGLMIEIIFTFVLVS